MEERLAKDILVDSYSYILYSRPGGTDVNTQKFLYFFKHDMTYSHLSLFANDGLIYSE